MSHVIYTVQINNTRNALLKDIPVVDITVMTGNPVFAPTWDMLKQYKSGQMNAATYQALYLNLIRETYQTHRQDWLSLLAMPSVALACYCRPGVFCHRHILKEALLRLHHRAGNEAVNGGELA